MVKLSLIAAFLLLHVIQLHAFDSRNFESSRRQPQSSGPYNQGDRGGWGVTVNKDKGRGPQIRTEAHGNIYSSKDGNWQVNGGANHEAGKGRKPDYGGNLSVTGRWRRNVDDGTDVVNEEAAIFEHESSERMKRSPKREGGSVDVTVNKNKGRGPQIRTEAKQNVYTSPNGNWKVNAGGHHEAGRGRKPDYGGKVSVSGRWRRDTDVIISEVEEEEDVDEVEPIERSKRSPKGERGSVDVTVNKDKGRGPQIRTEAKQNVYTSPNGNWRVDAGGHHEAGRGRKPDYGGQVSISGRWRRDTDAIASSFEEEETVDEAEPIERSKRSPKKERGSVDVTVNKDKGRGPQIRTEAKQNVYTSPNGNWRVDAGGHHEAGRGRKPDYGGKVSVGGRWRRDTEGIISDVEEDEDVDEAEPMERSKRSPKKERGSVDVTVNKDKGRGPQIRTEAKQNVYTSPNGNWRVDAGGHHEAGRGRKPDYGGKVSVGGRWRRDTEGIISETEDEQAIDEAEPIERSKRSPKSDGGSVDVSVSKDKGRGPQVRTDAQQNIYTSSNGNWRVDAGGYHEAGKGRKPDYGGTLTVTGRWRRSTEVNDDISDTETEPLARLKRSPQNRGSIDITAGQNRGQGPYIRTDGRANVYTSPNGNWKVDGHGFHEAGRGMKPNYGGGATLTGPSGDLSVTHNRGGPFRTDGRATFYTSPNRNWNVGGYGYHEAGKGMKPNYGGGVSVTGRFRRDTDPIN